jgi:Mg-chelatase subunit ChlD
METFPGVSVAVGAFPGNQLVLPFGQRVRHAEARFKLQSWGGTPMAEGIRMASRLLQRRQEPRKLLFVLTDGEPDNKPNARAAILGAQHIGIETFGIGIQCRSVERLFEQSIVLQTVTELPEKMFALIDTKLGRKAA